MCGERADCGVEGRCAVTTPLTTYDWLLTIRELEMADRRFYIIRDVEWRVEYVNTAHYTLKNCTEREPPENFYGENDADALWQVARALARLCGRKVRAL